MLNENRAVIFANLPEFEQQFAQYFLCLHSARNRNQCKKWDLASLSEVRMERFANDDPEHLDQELNSGSTINSSASTAPTSTSISCRRKSSASGVSLSSAATKRIFSAVKSATSSPAVNSARRNPLHHHRQ